MGMTDISGKVKTSRPAIPQIYAYTTPEVPSHDGWTKIGYTEQDVETRIKQQSHTIDVYCKLEWHGNATWEDGSGIAYCPASGADGSEETRSAVWHEAGGHAFGKLADETIWHGGFMEFCNCACCPHADEIRRMQERGW